MDISYLKGLLTAVAAGETLPEEALEVLKKLSFEDIGFANIDHQRSLRTGQAETIYCAGKTPEQVAEIVDRMKKTTSTILATRATTEAYEAVRKVAPDAVYHELARIISIKREIFKGLSNAEGYRGEAPASKKTIAVITAGTSDIPVAEEAAVTAEMFGNQVDRIYDVGVAGIHRLFSRLDQIRNANVIIVVAGMEGALASVVGGLVDRPVIAVPTSVGYGASFGGISALLTMLNSCANGIGVVNIDNGFGAACLASKMNQ